MKSLNHAIALKSKHPGVRAGGFEIRAEDARIAKRYAAVLAREAASE